MSCYRSRETRMVRVNKFSKIVITVYLYKGMQYMISSFLSNKLNQYKTLENSLRERPITSI